MDDDLMPLIYPSPEIPDYWTPEIACEVADFLNTIIQAIWATHSAAMARYFERPLPPEASATSSASLDDDLPF